MTNKIIVKDLKAIADFFISESQGAVPVALEEAIKIIEQQSCEDCVSREAALEAVEEQKKGFYGVERYAIDECYSAIMKLPSVKPQRPKGKWINNTYNHHCSECGYGLTNETYMFYGLNRENDERHDCYCVWEDNLMNYCPCCGAEMGGEDGKKI